MLFFIHSMLISWHLMRINLLEVVAKMFMLDNRHKGEPLPYSPSQRGTALSHTTLPSLRMQEMVCEPWVLTKPSSHRNEMELPSWRLSPKRFPLTGTPGSGHSLWRNAVERQRRDGVSVNIGVRWWGQREKGMKNVYIKRKEKKACLMKCS